MKNERQLVGIKYKKMNRNPTKKKYFHEYAHIFFINLKIRTSYEKNEINIF